jgi:biotin-dependent carboxylase-like uncharacterized protein
LSEFRSALRVVSAGFYPTVQDLGRYGAQRLGVPTSGALDPLALRMANALVGNDEGEAGLEIRLIGPTIEVAADDVRVALVGTEAPIEVLAPGSGVRVAPGRSVRLSRGVRFRVGAVKDTSCCYLAVAGGFDLPAPFGSKSTYVRSAIGGLEGRPLRDGDELPLVRGAAPQGPDRILPMVGKLYGAGAVRIVLGPQDGWFTTHALEVLLSGSYEVSRHADRMGLRLEGPELEHARGFNIVSDGIASGAIQVPGSRKPIILLADHQTTGGYPKIATIISADLPRVGRLRPGAKLGFRAVGVAEAEELRRTQEALLARVLNGVRDVEGAPPISVSALHRDGLLSGAFSIGTG